MNKYYFWVTLENKAPAMKVAEEGRTVLVAQNK